MAETRKAFHEELDELNTDVVRLAALCTEAIQAGTAALLDFDLAGADNVIADDKLIDDLAHSIEERVYLLLARQQPMASDLRAMVSILRVIHELERVGDLMRNVAKATRRLFPTQLEPKLRGIIARMRDQATAQMLVASDAFADRDIHRAAALHDMDDVMDDLQKELFRYILSSSESDEAAIQRAVQMALVGRHFERIADHTVNLGDRVNFMVTGRFGSAVEDDADDDDDDAV
jgi:phosphate transport system protein